MSTKLFDSYQTDGSNNQISLSVKIGNAQIGVASVTIDGNQLIVKPPADNNGNYRADFTIPLGTNATLNGKTLVINTNVELSKVPTASSVNIELFGGTGPHAYGLQSGAGSALGSVVNYYASISFI